MRIAYCTNVRLPSERAHGHQIAHVCDALAALGHDITIFAPHRNNIVTQDYYLYYHASPQVHLKHLGSFDPISSPLFPGVLGLWTLNMMLRKNLAKTNIAGFDLLYTRTPALLPTLLATDRPVILELHQLPRRNRGSFVSQCNRCAKVVCLTSPMKEILQKWGVHASKIIVEGDAVDLERFLREISTTDARKFFGITTGRPVVRYVGRLTTLGQDKGVADLLRAIAALRTTQPVFGVIVGGPTADQRKYEKMAFDLHLTESDVLFTGEIVSHDVPRALAACDFLAMPFPDRPHFRTNMSPLKMFEYMAAGKPIITSDLPSIRDVLTPQMAFFCRPGDHVNLAETIHHAIGHADDARLLAAKAHEHVKEHSWEKRMSRILSSIS